MKKICLSLATALLLFSCQKEDNATNDAPKASKRVCASQEVLERQLKEDPGLAARMSQIEAFTENAMLQNNRLVNGKIEIPVVVNVLYRTTAENISLTQIQSQIDVLNKDFNALNSDFNQVPTLFSGVKANVGISFVLDQVSENLLQKLLGEQEMQSKKQNQEVLPLLAQLQN